MKNDNKKFKIIKYLGVDWGESRIGLALGDSETKIAVPFKVVGNIGEMLKVIKEEDIDITVVGVPFKMSNVKAKVSGEFNGFLGLLKEKSRIPVKRVDERLSSKAADALAGDKKTNPPSSRRAGLRRARAPRDAVAAMVILQTYLDIMPKN